MPMEKKMAAVSEQRTEPDAMKYAKISAACLDSLSAPAMTCLMKQMDWAGAGDDSR